MVSQNLLGNQYVNWALILIMFLRPVRYDQNFPVVENKIATEMTIYLAF